MWMWMILLLWLSTFLLGFVWLIYYLYCIFTFTNDIFPFVIFTFLIVPFSFSLKVILTILVEVMGDKMAE